MVTIMRHNGVLDDGCGPERETRAQREAREEADELRAEADAIAALAAEVRAIGAKAAAMKSRNRVVTLALHYWSIALDEVTHDGADDAAGHLRNLAEQTENMA